MENKKIKVYMAESEEGLKEQFNKIYDADSYEDIHIVDSYTEELNGVWVAVIVYVHVSPFYVEL